MNVKTFAITWILLVSGVMIGLIWLGNSVEITDQHYDKISDKDSSNQDKMVAITIAGLVVFYQLALTIGHVAMADWKEQHFMPIFILYVILHECCVLGNASFPQSTLTWIDIVYMALLIMPYEDKPSMNGYEHVFTILIATAATDTFWCGFVNTIAPCNGPNNAYNGCLVLLSWFVQWLLFRNPYMCFGLVGYVVSPRCGFLSFVAATLMSLLDGADFYGSVEDQRLAEYKMRLAQFEQVLNKATEGILLNYQKRLYPGTAPNSHLVNAYEKFSDAFDRISDMANLYQMSHPHTAAHDQIKFPKKIVIAVTGRMRSGKDTLGDYICENYSFTRLAFADSLKQVCKITFHLEHEQLHDQKLKETVDQRYGKTPRQIMQQIGMMMRREMGDDVWVNNLLTRLNNVQSGLIVITDARFENEIEALRRAGAVVVRIVRGSSKETAEIPGDMKSNHQSEVEHERIPSDYTVLNYVGLDIREYHRQIDELLLELLKKVKISD